MNLHLYCDPNTSLWWSGFESARFSLAEHLGDPGSADAILAFGAVPKLSRILAKKLFLCSMADDDVLPFAPGLYASLHRRNRVPGTCGCPYFHVMGAGLFDEISAGDPREFLYSFRGAAANASVRKSIMAIRDGRASLNDTTRHDTTRHVEYKNAYYAGLRDSQFVLCPRGYGPSSIRLYESMRAGRAPVILSDDWLPPDDVAWDRFTVRVKERDVMRLPEILRERESEAVELGQQARIAWNKHFSAQGLPEWLARQVERLLAERKRFRRMAVLCHPRNSRLLWRAVRARIRQAIPRSKSIPSK